jgi:hypothetical protein
LIIDDLLPKVKWNDKSRIPNSQSAIANRQSAISCSLFSSYAIVKKNMQPLAENITRFLAQLCDHRRFGD